MTKEVVKTQKIADSLEVDLILENSIYFLILRITGENPEEKQPIEINNDKVVAEKIFNEIIKLSLISIGPNTLWQLITNKVLSELYGLPGIIPDKLFE